MYNCYLVKSFIFDFFIIFSQCKLLLYFEQYNLHAYRLM